MYVVNCSIIVCYMKVITKYGLGYVWSIHATYVLFVWSALVLPYPFVDLIFGTPRIINGKNSPRH